MSVGMPPMTRGQGEAWSGLLDLSERHPSGWTLVGGQMVHLHCIERGIAPTRPTDDVDTVLDVRAEPGALHSFTTALVELGFASSGESWEGHQHRWQRGEAQIDVLIPRHLGERAAGRRGVSAGRRSRRQAPSRHWTGRRLSRSFSTGAAALCVGRVCSARWSRRPPLTPSSSTELGLDT
jgi:hypothetical protein